MKFTFKNFWLSEPKSFSYSENPLEQHRNKKKIWLKKLLIFFLWKCRVQEKKKDSFTKGKFRLRGNDLLSFFEKCLMHKIVCEQKQFFCIICQSSWKHKGKSVVFVVRLFFRSKEQQQKKGQSKLQSTLVLPQWQTQRILLTNKIKVVTKKKDA